jgi:hypothetical protein
MRYRKLSPTGDYTFGQSLGNYYIDQAECVQQSCFTRLQLNQGDWFLDTSAGVPWTTRVLGNKASPRTRDIVIKSVILGTSGLVGIVPNTWSATQVLRQLSISAQVYTIYTATPIDVVAVI